MRSGDAWEHAGVDSEINRSNGRIRRMVDALEPRCIRAGCRRRRTKGVQPSLDLNRTGQPTPVLRRFPSVYDRFSSVYCPFFTVFTVFEKRLGGGTMRRVNRYRARKRECVLSRNHRHGANIGQNISQKSVAAVVPEPLLSAETAGPTFSRRQNIKETLRDRQPLHSSSAFACCAKLPAARLCQPL